MNKRLNIIVLAILLALPIVFAQSPAYLEFGKIRQSFSDASGIPVEYLKFPELLYYLIIPSLAIIAVNYGFLREFRIFERSERVNIIISISVGLAAIGSKFTYFVGSFLLNAMGIIGFLVFAGIFFIGLFFFAKSGRERMKRRFGFSSSPLTSGPSNPPEGPDNNTDSDDPNIPIQDALADIASIEDTIKSNPTTPSQAPGKRAALASLDNDKKDFGKIGNTADPKKVADAIDSKTAALERDIENTRKAAAKGELSQPDADAVVAAKTKQRNVLQRLKNRLTRRKPAQPINSTKKSYSQEQLDKKTNDIALEDWNGESTDTSARTSPDDKSKSGTIDTEKAINDVTRKGNEVVADVEREEQRVDHAITKVRELERIGKMDSPTAQKLLVRLGIAKQKLASFKQIILKIVYTFVNFIRGLFHKVTNKFRNSNHQRELIAYQKSLQELDKSTKEYYLLKEQIEDIIRQVENYSPVSTDNPERSGLQTEHNEERLGDLLDRYNAEFKQASAEIGITKDQIQQIKASQRKGKISAEETNKTIASLERKVYDSIEQEAVMLNKHISWKQNYKDSDFPKDMKLKVARFIPERQSELREMEKLKQKYITPFEIIKEEDEQSVSKVEETIDTEKIVNEIKEKGDTLVSVVVKEESRVDAAIRKVRELLSRGKIDPAKAQEMLNKLNGAKQRLVNLRDNILKLIKKFINFIKGLFYRVSDKLWFAKADRKLVAYQNAIKELQGYDKEYQSIKIMVEDAIRDVENYTPESTDNPERQSLQKDYDATKLADVMSRYNKEMKDLSARIGILKSSIPETNDRIRKGTLSQAEGNSDILAAVQEAQSLLEQEVQMINSHITWKQNYTDASFGSDMKHIAARFIPERKSEMREIESRIKFFNDIMKGFSSDESGSKELVRKLPVKTIEEKKKPLLVSAFNALFNRRP